MSKPIESVHKGIDAQSNTERLAQETNTPLERVTELYAAERAALEQTARVTTFIGVLATRRVRRILAEEAWGT
jgi:hypothetical protein